MTMKHEELPDYGPRDIDDEYFQEIYRADRVLARAEKGDLEAMYEMGLRFYFGEGRRENYRLALKYFLKPAEEGNACAQYYVGSIYETGETENEKEFRGVKQNPEEAALWFAKAAALGNEDAAKALERLREAGLVSSEK